MDQIETSSTSSRTAVATPIVLRQTDRVRLTFRPVLLRNDAQPRACVRGEFLYEKKGAAGEWHPANTESLGTIKSGEAFKLELHSSELLLLVEALGPLYRTQWSSDGIQIGKQTYVKLETSLARFLGLTRQALDDFLDKHPGDAITVLNKILQWLSTDSQTDIHNAALAGLDPKSLPSVSALLGLSSLKLALNEWEANRSNAKEPFWQDCLARHSFVLSQIFAHPLVVIQQRAYLGGKALDDSGGSYLDFLAASPATEAVAIIEIKTPATSLLGGEYRGGAYPPSSELAGAIAQVLKYRRTFSRDFDRLARASGRDLVLGAVPCVVVVGDAEIELSKPDLRESFEAFRAQLRDVRIVTYDELFRKVRVSAELLEGISAPPV